MESVTGNFEPVSGRVWTTSYPEPLPPSFEPYSYRYAVSNPGAHLEPHCYCFGISVAITCALTDRSDPGPWYEPAPPVRVA